jgi:hypothetical protein
VRKAKIKELKELPRTRLKKVPPQQPQTNESIESEFPIFMVCQVYLLSSLKTGGIMQTVVGALIIIVILLSAKHLGPQSCCRGS